MIRTSWCRRESPMMPEAMCPTPLNTRTIICRAVAHPTIVTPCAQRSTRFANNSSGNVAGRIVLSGPGTLSWKRQRRRRPNASMSVVAVDQADRAQMQLGALLDAAALARRDAEAALATARSDLQACERVIAQLRRGDEARRACGLPARLWQALWGR